MFNSNQKKADLLGEPFGTAGSRLRKMLLFKYVNKCGETICYRCNTEIKTIDEFSIEHKMSWMNSPDPKKDFFNLDQITFSHLLCNTAAAIKPNKKYHTVESRNEKTRKINAASHRRNYTTEKRRERKLKTGN